MRGAPALIGFLAVAGSASPSRPDDAARGAVVTRVDPGSQSDRAGVRVGDRLRAWQQDAAGAATGGPLRSPFDLVDVELERAPRGEVRLSAERDDAVLELRLSIDDWGLDTRPAFEEAARTAYEDARRALDAGDRDTGIARLRAAIAGSPRADDRVWLLLALARAHDGPGASADADAALAQALEAAHGILGMEVHVQAAKGRLLQRREAQDAAAAAFEAALALRRELAPDGLAVAASLEELGILNGRRRASAQARQCLEEAAALRERSAPRSLALAEGWCRLGQALHESGDSAGAVARFRSGLELAESLGPPSRATGRCLVEWGAAVMSVGRLDEAQVLLRRANEFYERRDAGGIGQTRATSSLAIVSNLQGDLAEAERLHRQVLAMNERRGPSASVATTMSNLGIISKSRGDLAEAERWYARALAMNQSQDPDGAGVALVLNNLGSLALERKDFVQAEGYLTRALAAEERKNPGSLTAATILANLSRVARERKDLGAAEAFARRALAIREALAPTHTGTAATLAALADVLVARGRLDEAQGLQERALAIREKEAPGGLLYSYPLHDLGMLSLRRGDLERAERRHAEALAIRSEVAPDSLLEAESSHALGVTLRRQRRTEEALARLRRAVDAIEAQGRRLGGSAESRAGFRAHYEEYYRDLEDLLIELGRTEEALHVVERSRARTLLALMASRDLRFSRDVPEELDQERRRADAAHDALLRQLGSAPPARRPELKAGLEDARTRQAEVRARIRAEAPRLARVRDPEALDLAGVRSALDPGTLALVYSLGERGARLYAIGPGPAEFSVHALPGSADDLGADVAQLLETIRRRRGTLLQSALESQSRRLTARLLGPVAGRIGGAARLLVVPDGPLHLLPFAALRDPSHADRYLVEAKALHNVSSLTLFAQLKPAAGAPNGPAAVEGFGDPTYLAAVTSDAPPAVRDAVRSGLRLDPLPWTRAELAALRGLSPSARLWLGAEATEARAKSLEGPHRVVHFACHGISDADSPLESGLALAMPAQWKEGDDNGLLQAWEVFENVRIAADLVTLSACETGLGKELRGEGMLSLTWAFQYAGARSVLASLWEVNDTSTAELMRRFYGHLGQGVPKAEALRRAQVEVLKRSATRAPYFWAAFQLTGDWR